MWFFFLAFVSAFVAVGCEKDQSLSDSTQKLTPASEAPAVPLKAAPLRAATPKGNAAWASESENNGIQAEHREGEPMDDVDDSMPVSSVDKSAAASPKKTRPSGGRAEDDPDGDEADGEG